MSNELQLSNDIHIITAEINSYKQIAGQSIFEIGRRLKWVKENDLAHGDFGNWLEKNVDMSWQTANKFMKTYTEFGDYATSRNLSTSKIFELLSLPDEVNKDEFLTKKHLIPSTNKEKNVNDMTIKELREVKKVLKKTKEEKEKLTKLLMEERKKPVKVETKVIEKEIEIDNTDYESINKLKKQLQQKRKDYELLLNEKSAIEKKMRLTEQENQDFQNLKTQIQRLSKEKEDIGRQIEAATSISGLVVEIDYVIKEKLAPIKYSRAIQEMQDDEVVINNLSEILETVESWCNEMRTYLPNSRKIINMEVL